MTSPQRAMAIMQSIKCSSCCSQVASYMRITSTEISRKRAPTYVELASSTWFPRRRLETQESKASAVALALQSWYASHGFGKTFPGNLIASRQRAGDSELPQEVRNFKATLPVMRLRPFMGFCRGHCGHLGSCQAEQLQASRAEDCTAQRNQP